MLEPCSSESKLTALKERLVSEVDAAASTLPTIVADSLDDEAVKRLVSQAKVRSERERMETEFLTVVWGISERMSAERREYNSLVFGERADAGNSNGDRALLVSLSSGRAHG